MSQHTITESTLREWMDKFGPRLLVLSTGICRNRHQAEEIVQEAFVKLWKAPPDAGEIAYSSWLRRVVTNLSINALQRTKRAAPLPEFSVDRSLQASGSPEDAMDRREEAARLRAALDRLDPAKRTILMLRASEQLSYEEIAAHLDVPIGTVMSRLNRARTALMAELQRESAEERELPDSFPIRKYRSA